VAEDGVTTSDYGTEYVRLDEIDNFT